MKRKAVSGIMLTLLLISMLTLAFNIQPVRANGTVYIRPDGSVEGTDKIQRDGDIYTLTGNIYDGIVVERNNMTLDGAGYTIQGTGAEYSWIIGINLFYRSNVTVKNTKVTKFGTGISLFRSSNNIVSGNNVSYSGYGICLESSSNNTLVANTVSNNFYDFVVWGFRFSDFNNRVDRSNTVNGKPIYYLIGVANTIYDAQTNGGTFYLINSNNVTIRDLTVTQNGQGVFFWNTTNSKIENVTASNNHFGIVLAHSDNNAVTGNNALNNGAGILLDRSSNNNVLAGNSVENNLYGIWLEYSSNNNVLSGNNASNNQAGIYLEDSSNIILTGNNAFNNYMGIRLYNSNNNVLSGNNASNNYYGIWLYSSSNNNIVFHNNFIDNSIQAYSSESINIWDDSYPSGGNYWSDQYHGDCADHFSGPGQDIPGSDGIVDAPYPIEVDNQDNYPLMEPWTPLPRTIGELKTEIEELGSEDEIDNQGIVKSLIAKLNVAQKLVDKGKVDEAKMVLEDFIIQVKELSEIHITVEAADILIQSAGYIVSHL